WYAYAMVLFFACRKRIVEFLRPRDSPITKVHKQLPLFPWWVWAAVGCLVVGIILTRFNNWVEITFDTQAEDVIKGGLAAISFAVATFVFLRCVRNYLRKLRASHSS